MDDLPLQTGYLPEEEFARFITVLDKYLVEKLEECGITPAREPTASTVCATTTAGSSIPSNAIFEGENEKSVSNVSNPPNSDNAAQRGKMEPQRTNHSSNHQIRTSGTLRDTGESAQSIGPYYLASAASNAVFEGENKKSVSNVSSPPKYTGNAVQRGKVELQRSNHSSNHQIRTSGTMSNTGELARSIIGFSKANQYYAPSAASNAVFEGENKKSVSNVSSPPKYTGNAVQRGKVEPQRSDHSSNHQIRTSGTLSNTGELARSIIGFSKANQYHAASTASNAVFEGENKKSVSNVSSLPKYTGNAVRRGNVEPQRSNHSSNHQIRTSGTLSNTGESVQSIGPYYSASAANGTHACTAFQGNQQNFPAPGKIRTVHRSTGNCPGGISRSYSTNARQRHKIDAPEGMDRGRLYWALTRTTISRPYTGVTSENNVDYK